MLNAMNSTSPKRLSSPLIFLVIIILAALLRLPNPGIAEFKYDEARLCQYSADLITHRQIPIVGISSSRGLPNPPLMIYLHAIPMLFSRNPAMIVVFIASLHTVSVGLTYLLGRRFFDKFTALVSAVLFATSPWAISDARKIGTHILPLLTVILLYTLFVIVVEKRHRAVIWLGIILALVTQTYLLTFLYGIVVLVIFLCFPARFIAADDSKPAIDSQSFKRHLWQWRYIFISASLFLLISAPYLIVVLGKILNTPGEIASGVWDEAFRLDSLAWRFSLWNASGFNLESLLGVSAPLFGKYAVALKVLYYLIGGLVLGGCIYAVYRIINRGSGYEKYAVLLIWYFVPVAIMTYRASPLLRTYLNMVYPAQFIFVAVALRPIWNFRLKKRTTQLNVISRVVVGGLICVICITQIASTFRLRQLLATSDTTGGFGVPLRQWQELITETKEIAAQEELSQIFIGTTGTMPRYENLPSILNYLLRPKLAPRFLNPQLPNAQFTIVSTENPALYLVTRDDAWLHDELSMRGAQVAHTDFITDKLKTWLYILPAYSANTPQHMLNARFSNGAKLAGYTAPNNLNSETGFILTTYWVIETTTPAQRARNYSVFNHLVNSTGKKWAQQDGMGFPSYAWQNGDVIIHHYPLDIPSTAPRGEYWILTGMYALEPPRDRAETVDEQGTRLDNQVKLGPFTLREQ